MAGNPLATKDDVRRAVVDLVEPIVRAPLARRRPGAPRQRSARTSRRGSPSSRATRDRCGASCRSSPAAGRSTTGTAGSPASPTAPIPRAPSTGGRAATTSTSAWSRWPPSGSRSRSRPSTCGIRSPGASATTSSSGCAASSAASRRRTTGSSSGCSCRWVSSASAWPSTARRRRARSRSLDSFAIDDGWYTDGARRQHRLLRAVRVPHLRARPRRVGSRRPRRRRALRRARATRSRPSSGTGSRADGGAFPFGRSLTYRMAQGSFWGALALADVDALDWADGARPRAAAPPLVERTTDQRPRRRAVGRLRLRQPPDGRVVQLGRLAVLVHEGVHHARRTRRPSVLDRRRGCAAAARDRHAAHAGHGARARRRPGGRADGAAAGLVVRRAGRRRSTTSSRTRAGSASAATSPCTDSAPPTRCWR